MGGAWPAQVSHQEVIAQSARLRPLWVWASSSRGGKQSGCPVGAALPRRSLWNKRREGIEGSRGCCRDNNPNRQLRGGSAPARAHGQSPEPHL